MKNYKKASVLLRDVKKNLPKTFSHGMWNDKSPYICDSIDELCSNRDLAIRLRADITRMIGGKFSLPRWLASRGFEECFDYPELIQIHRQKWLDRLIVEYEERGD